MEQGRCDDTLSIAARSRGMRTTPPRFEKVRRCRGEAAAGTVQPPAVGGKRSSGGRVVVEYMEGTFTNRAPDMDGRTRNGGGSARARARDEADRAHICERVSVDPRFIELRRRVALRNGFLVASFLIAYMAHLLLSAYARDFMSVQILDSINVALLLGLGQFLFAFVLAWSFGRSFTRSIDPLAEEIREHARQENTVDGRVVG